MVMLWGLDPVHPLKEGDLRIAATICKAAHKLGAKPEDMRKRAGSLMGPPGKKPRVEITRPRWVEEHLWSMEANNMGEVAEAEGLRLAEVGARGSTGLWGEVTSRRPTPVLLMHYMSFFFYRTVYCKNKKTLKKFLLGPRAFNKYIYIIICRKTFKKKSFLLASWRSMMKIEGSGSINQRHGSADPDPDPQHKYHGSTTLISRNKMLPFKPELGPPGAIFPLDHRGFDV
jgi:hypothetical protein